MHTTLIIMTAGIGSRFGTGIKQPEKIVQYPVGFVWRMSPEIL